MDKFTRIPGDNDNFRRSMYEAYNKKCVYCGIPLMYKEMQIDHIIPKSAELEDVPNENGLRDDLIKYGFFKESLENKVISCGDCNNSKKHAGILDEGTLRFFFYYAFKTRGSVLSKYKKYTATPIENEIVDVKGLRSNSIRPLEKEPNLIQDKYISRNPTYTAYIYGTGNVYIHAFLPSDYEEKLSCLIYTKTLYSAAAMYTLDDEQIKEWLFSCCGKDYTDRHWFLFDDKDREDSMYTIRFPNIRLVVDEATVKDLCMITDDLYQEYITQIETISEIIGANHFDKDDLDRIPIAEMDESVWKDIKEFAKHHDIMEEISEWNIFNAPVGGYDSIYVSSNTHDREKQCGIAVRLESEPVFGGRRRVFWHPGSKSVLKMNNFDNILKWKVDYSHNWLLYKLIPHIYYEKMSFLNKMMYQSAEDSRFIKSIFEEYHIQSYMEQ